MNLTLTGCGYLGIVIAACFASHKHRVLCYDKNPDRLSLDHTPYEPGLDNLITAHKANISFTDRFEDVLAWGNTHYVCVSSPPLPSGLIDTSNVLDVTDNFRGQNGFNLFIKTTLPVGTTRKIMRRLHDTGNTGFHVVFEPEFTSEGNAVNEFLHSTYRVFGCDNYGITRPLINEIYASFDTARHLFMSPESAELSKLSTNAMLACRLSFINELANYTQTCGADINDVCAALGSDKRIGRQYLKPGIGYGGICLPKDTDSLLHQMNEADSARVLSAVGEVNREQCEQPLKILLRHFGKNKNVVVAVWGLAFKAHTSDTRHSPGIKVAKRLSEQGYTVRVYDPEATLSETIPNCVQTDDAFAAAEQADAVVICTDWPQFAETNFKKLAQTMRQAVLLDCKHTLDPALAKRANFTFLSIGRRD